MNFYLDENVPASVQKVLEDRGHQVTWTRDIVSEGAPDDVVARVSEVGDAVLVSHDRDFKKIASRIPDGQRTRFRRLSMVRMACEKPKSAERMRLAIPFIEFDASIRGQKRDQRSIIEVKKGLISITC